MTAWSVVPKDPGDVLDYEQDWSSWLSASETISTSTFTVEAGITKDSESNTSTAAKVWLSGGTAGEQYTITNTITTNQGRTVNRSFEVAVEER